LPIDTLFIPLSISILSQLSPSPPLAISLVISSLHSPPLPRSGRLCPAIPACCDSKQVFGTADRCCTGRVTSLADVVVIIIKEYCIIVAIIGNIVVF
jgi:hypothetical protein